MRSDHNTRKHHFTRSINRCDAQRTVRAEVLRRQFNLATKCPLRMTNPFAVELRAQSVNWLLHACTRKYGVN